MKRICKNCIYFKPHRVDTILGFCNSEPIPVRKSGDAMACRFFNSKPSEDIMVCSHCGSDDVLVDGFIDINKNEIYSIASDMSDPEKCWCNECDTNTTLIKESEFNYNK